MPVEQRYHLLLKLLAELIPVALVLRMGKQRREKIDVLYVQPAPVTGEQIGTTIFEWQLAPYDTTIAVAGPLPPLKGAVEISPRVIDHEALSSLVATISADRCFEIGAGVAPECVRREVKPYCEERRATQVEPSR